MYQMIPRFVFDFQIDSGLIAVQHLEMSEVLEASGGRGQVKHRRNCQGYFKRQSSSFQDGAAGQ